MRVVTGGIAAAALCLSVAARAAEKTADYTFDYTYPAAAAQIAPLHAWLEADKAKLHARIASESAADRAGSRKSGFPFSPYDALKTWKVVTSTPRFLSLSGEVSTYTGGAHGQNGSLSLVWDKKAGRRIDAASVFVSSGALQAVFGAPWCAWVVRERSKRIRSDASKDAFLKCPAIKELTLLLGSADGRRIDRIGLIADQYVAGSYAEGEYETTLPVTAAVLAVVKPVYRADFAIR